MTPSWSEICAWYRRPKVAAVATDLRRLADAMRAGDIEALGAANELRVDLATARHVSQLRYAACPADPSAASEEAFWATARGQLVGAEVEFARALLDSPAGEAIDARFGPQLRRRQRCLASSFDAAAESHAREEAIDAAEHTRIMSRPLRVRGHAMSWGESWPLMKGEDRDLTNTVLQARDAFLQEQGPALDELFGRLVARRTAIAQAVGASGFAEVAYRRLGRSDYGPSEVAALREEIRTNVVPLVNRLFAARAARMGIASVGFDDRCSAVPLPAPIDDPLTAVSDALASFDPELGDLLASMRRGGLLDLEPRLGKADGGMCLTLYRFGVPFVFGTLSRGEHGLRLLAHEMGHAANAHLARTQPVLEYLEPTYEAAEIASMGMEHLLYPHFSRRLGGETARLLERLGIEHNLCLLPELAAMDEFQDEVYARPSASAAERRAMWSQVEARYLPHRLSARAALPSYGEGRYWQQIAHPFESPFYMIDYVLAQACALQLWLRARHDPGGARAAYRRMCAAGGRLSFVAIVAAGELESPLVHGTVTRVVTEVLRCLEGQE